MATLVQIYLLDSEGNYVTDAFGNRIVIDEYTLDVDDSWRAIGGNLRRSLRGLGIKSFDIARDSGGEWYLRVNQHLFIGRYPTQAAAFSVLRGMYTNNKGYDDGFTEYIEYALANGSTIESGVNNINLSRTQGMLDITDDPNDASYLVVDLDGGDEVFLNVGGLSDLILRVSEYEESELLVYPDDTIYLTYQTSTDGIAFTTDTSDMREMTALDGAGQEEQWADVYGNLPVGNYIRGVLIAQDTQGNNVVRETGISYQRTANDVLAPSTIPEEDTYTEPPIVDPATVVAPDRIQYYTSSIRFHFDAGTGNELRDNYGLRQIYCFDGTMGASMTFNSNADAVAFQNLNSFEIDGHTIDLTLFTVSSTTLATNGNTTIQTWSDTVHSDFWARQPLAADVEVSFVDPS